MKVPGIKNFLISAAAGAVAIFVREIAHAGQSNVSGYVYAVLAAAATFIALNWFFRLPLVFPWVRLLAKDEERFAGEWIETVEKDNVRYYTVFGIHYVWGSDDYVVSGVSLKCDGCVHADWDSLYLKFNKDVFALSFLYTSRQTSKENMTGYAELTFFRNNDIKPCEGKGFFVDMGLQPIRVEFKLERVTKPLMKKFLGERRVKLTGKQRIEFIKKYHEYSEN